MDALAVLLLLDLSNLVSDVWEATIRTPP